MLSPEPNNNQDPKATDCYHRAEPRNAKQFYVFRKVQICIAVFRYLIFHVHVYISAIMCFFQPHQP